MNRNVFVSFPNLVMSPSCLGYKNHLHKAPRLGLKKDMREKKQVMFGSHFNRMSPVVTDTHPTQNGVFC